MEGRIKVYFIFIFSVHFNIRSYLCMVRVERDPQFLYYCEAEGEKKVPLSYFCQGKEKKFEKILLENRLESKESPSCI